MIKTFSRFGRKKGVFISMLLAAAGAAGSVLLTALNESPNAEANTGKEIKNYHGIKNSLICCDILGLIYSFHISFSFCPA